MRHCVLTTSGNIVVCFHMAVCLSCWFVNYVMAFSICHWANYTQGRIQGVSRVSGHPPLWYGALFEKNIFSKHLAEEGASLFAKTKQERNHRFPIYWPNIRKLMIIGCTLPVGSCEAEIMNVRSAGPVLASRLTGRRQMALLRRSSSAAACCWSRVQQHKVWCSPETL